MCVCVRCVQMRLVTLLGMGSTEADARHLQSITQQLSQATEEIQLLTIQLQSSEAEVVRCH